MIRQRRKVSRRGPRTWFALFGSCALLWMHPGPSAAQATIDDGTRAAARELGQQGIDAYLRGDYVTANQRLEKAYQLFVTATMGLWSARARMQLGHWVEAAERYRETLGASVAVGNNAVQQQAHNDAAAELEALLPRLASLTVELVDAEPASVVLHLDGKPVSSELFGVARPTNPGAHRVVITRGELRAEAQVQLAEREHKVVSLRLSQPVAAAPAAVVQPSAAILPAAVAATTSSSSKRSTLVTLAIVELAFGGAGLAAAGVTALMANGQCSGGRCLDWPQRNAFRKLREVSTIVFWAGAAFTAGGVVTWLAAPKASDEPQGGLSWSISPFGVDVRGAL